MEICFICLISSKYAVLWHKTDLPPIFWQIILIINFQFTGDYFISWAPLVSKYLSEQLRWIVGNLLTFVERLFDIDAQLVQLQWVPYEAGDSKGIGYDRFDPWSGALWVQARDVSVNIDYKWNIEYFS